MSTIIDLDDGDGATVSTARQRANAVNGAKGGMPAGGTHSDKRGYDPDALAESLAERIIKGQGVPRTPLAHGEALTEQDRSHVRRITGIPAEEFQGMIIARLQVVADKSTARVIEKLDEGGQKLSDLNMTMAIAIDKLAAASGRVAQSGSVSVTVNNYGAMSRAEILSSLDKATAIEV